MGKLIRVSMFSLQNVLKTFMQEFLRQGFFYRDIICTLIQDAIFFPDDFQHLVTCHFSVLFTSLMMCLGQSTWCSLQAEDLM